jgi:hypothetical protein
MSSNPQERGNKCLANVVIKRKTALYGNLDRTYRRNLKTCTIEEEFMALFAFTKLVLYSDLQTL